MAGGGARHGGQLCGSGRPGVAVTLRRLVNTPRFGGNGGAWSGENRRDRAVVVDGTERPRCGKQLFHLSAQRSHRNTSTLLMGRRHTPVLLNCLSGVACDTQLYATHNIQTAGGVLPGAVRAGNDAV